MTSIMQKSFGSGEITPALYSRTDINKYQSAAKKIRNMYVMRHGGVQNRPGTQFVGEVKDSSKTVRLIPFVFSNTQTYCLEFGDLYIRVIKNGEYVKLTGQNITAITNANPCVVTYSGSDTYSNGDIVYISGIAGDLGQYLNGRSFKVANVNTGSNTFELDYMDGTNVNSTSFGSYTSGGTLEEIYELTSTYSESDLPLLKYVQSADVVTIVHPTYAPRTLSRTSDTEWTLETIAFGEGVDYPHTITCTPTGAAGSTTYNYVITAFDPLTGTETPMKANPPVAPYLGTTSTGNATLSSTNYNALAWTLSNSSTCTFDNTTDTITHSITIPSTPASYSTVRFRKDSGATMPTGVSENLTYYIVATSSTTFKIAITLANAQAGSYVNFTTNGSGTIKCYFGYIPSELEFNIYRESNGIYGYVGTVAGQLTFNDIGAASPDVTDTPPRIYESFSDTGDYPSAITYYQQRLVVANTDNDVEKVMASKTGNFYDFSVSSPIQDDDAVIFKISGQRVNEVYHLVDLGVLLAFTESGEYAVNGDAGGTLTASAINVRQSSYNGSSQLLTPIVIGNSAVYVQARGNNVRDLNFRYESNDYTGDELSIYASHLVDNYSLVDWAYQKIPHSILWIVRDDGTLLGMTYVKEQAMLAWHTHDFDGGVVENVCSIPEGSEDTVYLTIQRTIDGVSKRYIEKFVTRKISDVRDIAILDSHLSYDGRNTGATTMTLSGSSWTYTDTLTLTASASFFASTDVGNEIQLYDTDGSVIRFTIDAYTSGTVVTGRPNRTVPASMQAVAITDWARAVDEVTGLWHLEGESVSVYADGYVVANPNNSSYTTVTVTNGKITLSEAYAVIYVGLPITSDLETLNIDSPDSTIVDRNKLINKVTLFVQESRGIWAGTEEPTSVVDGLYELKIREDESYDSSITLQTDVVDIITEATWNKNGRVFIRQIDPVPLTILSVTPSGYIPLRGG